MDGHWFVGQVFDDRTFFHNAIIFNPTRGSTYDLVDRAHYALRQQHDIKWVNGKLKKDEYYAR